MGRGVKKRPKKRSKKPSSFVASSLWFAKGAGSMWDMLPPNITELLEAGVSEFRWTPRGRSGPWAKYRVEKRLRDRAVLVQGTKFSPGSYANPIRLGGADSAADMRYLKKVQEAFGPAFKAPVLKLKKFA